MYFARSGVVIGGYYRHREASRFHLPRSIITQQSAPSRGLSGGQGADFASLNKRFSQKRLEADRGSKIEVATR
jgi:hypothetical protein